MKFRICTRFIGTFNSFMGVMEAESGNSKAQLQYARDLNALSTNLEERVVESQAAVKRMLVELAQLYNDITLAGLQRVEAELRKQNLLLKVENVVQDGEFRAAQLTNERTNDPTFRVLRSRAVLDADRAFRRAQIWMYRAARNFEFQTGKKLPSIANALLSARRASALKRYGSCLRSEFLRFLVDVGGFQSFTEEFSLRRDIWGITGPITDPVTGQEVSVSERFQRHLLDTNNLSPEGNVIAYFATSVDPGNPLFSSGICIDTLQRLRVKLIGDGQGDDSARLRLEPRGATFLRGCDSQQLGAGDVIQSYVLDPRLVELVVGVNDYADSAPDIQLAGRPVANSEWRLVIPGPEETPTNSDLDLTTLEDIVFEITHSGVSLGSGDVSFEPVCP